MHKNDDLISRQAAISAICNACGKIDCDKMDKCEKLQLPPANCSEFPNSSDTISRQQATDALRKMQTYKLFSGDDMLLIDQAGAQTELMLLPSAQPEIIRCKDCKHFAGEGMYCSCDIIVQFDHFYCYHAERRQDV